MAVTGFSHDRRLGVKAPIAGAMILGLFAITPAAWSAPSDTAPAAPPALHTPSFKQFAEWCTNQASLMPGAKHTVEVLLEKFGTTDCTKANTRISRQTVLDLSRSQITDLGPLQSLTNLTLLQLEENQISDLAPIKGLTKLKMLVLNQNRIADLSPLKGLKNLNVLMLRTNQVSNLTPLQALTNLSRLSLDENQITDPSPLRSLKSLTSLSLGKNLIKSITSLQPLSQLNELTVSANPLPNQACPIQPAFVCRF